MRFYQAADDALLRLRRSTADIKRDTDSDNSFDIYDKFVSLELEKAQITELICT